MRVLGVVCVLILIGFALRSVIMLMSLSYINVLRILTTLGEEEGGGGGDGDGGDGGQGGGGLGVV